MSKSMKKKGGNVKKSTSDKTAAISDSRRNKLLSEIGDLRLVITRAECQLSTIKFKNVRGTENPCDEQSRELTKIPNVEVSLRNELYALAGVNCKKMGNGLIFNFTCWDAGVGFKNSYWIQLFNETGKWELGLWVLPMSIDVKAIVSDHPIDSPVDMKYFLRECKRRVDCYNRRKQQHKELEIFMTRLNLYNCYVEADIGYTRITIKLVKQVSASSDESRIIVVDLWYKSNETRPSRMIIDCDESRELSIDEAKKLRHYFKSFKELDLKGAAEKILMSNESRTIWRRASQEDRITIEEDEDDDVESGYARITIKRSRNREKGHGEENDTNDSARENNDASSKEFDLSKDNEIISRKKVSRPVGRPRKRKRSRLTANEKKLNNEISKTMKITNENYPENLAIDERTGETLKNRGKNFPLGDTNENLKKSMFSVAAKFSRQKKRVNFAIRGEEKYLPSSTPIHGRQVRPTIITDDDISEIVDPQKNQMTKSHSGRKNLSPETRESPDLEEKMRIEEKAKRQLLKDLGDVNSLESSVDKAGESSTMRKGKKVATRGAGKTKKKR